MNKWEKGASGRILLLLMEHLSKATSVKNAFEWLIQMICIGLDLDE